MGFLKKIINWLLNAILVVSIVVSIWIFSQVFLLASFRIPSDSMEPELVEGDFVAVWKPTLGARLFDLNATLRLEQTEIHRTPGFRKAKRGDVLVFNFPHPNGWDKIEMHILKYYIKRCIGLPGDTLSIRNGRFRINGTNEPLGNMDSQERIGGRCRESFQTVSIRHSRSTPSSVGTSGISDRSMSRKPVTRSK